MHRGKIPLCRSSFLQDVTIELGRRSLKSVRYSNSTLIFEVSEEDINGLNEERLNIEARSTTGSLTKVTLWQDAICWIYFNKGKRANTSHPAFEIHTNLAGMQSHEIAELLRATLKDAEEVLHVWQSRAIQSSRSF